MRREPPQIPLALGWAVALVAMMAAVGIACRGPESGTPDFLRTAQAPVREAYAYAEEHPEVLRYIPCYCGCVSSGHTSNEDCFIDQRLPDGGFVYDRHGAG